MKRRKLASVFLCIGLYRGKMLLKQYISYGHCSLHSIEETEKNWQENPKLYHLYYINLEKCFIYYRNYTKIFLCYNSIRICFRQLRICKGKFLENRHNFSYTYSCNNDTTKHFRRKQNEIKK